MTKVSGGHVPLLNLVFLVFMTVNASCCVPLQQVDGSERSRWTLLLWQLCFCKFFYRMLRNSFQAVILLAVLNVTVSFITLPLTDGDPQIFPTCTNDDFVCLSGDCIKQSFLCDGVKNCIDGSDESDETCGHGPAVHQTNENCRLPEQPLNGKYILGGCKPPTCQPVPGSTFPSVLLNYSCDSGYKLFGPHVIFCGEKWSSDFPTCEREQCGEFSFIERKANDGQSDQLPWYAAVLLFDKTDQFLQYKCSAVIISSRAIITAAHCFWKYIKSPTPEKMFLVAVGKMERWTFRDSISYEQQLEVDKILIPKGYRGLLKYRAEDISVVTLKEDIRFNDHITPVCIDFQNTHSSLFTTRVSGIVAAWGMSENGLAKQKVLTFNVADIEDCEENIPEHMLMFLTYDKFCAGDLNKTSLCDQDSGTGISHQLKDGKWYLTGISSFGVTTEAHETCLTRYYSGFTRVSLFYDFISRSLSNKESVLSDFNSPCRVHEYQCQSKECIDDSFLCNGKTQCKDGSDETSSVCGNVRCSNWAFKCKYGACIDKEDICNGEKNCADGSDEEAYLCRPMNSSSNITPNTGCKLPQQPENGNYEVNGCVDKFNTDVGSTVPRYVFLNYSCNSGYKLSGTSIIACLDGWSSEIPSCAVVMCPPLKNPSREIRCASIMEENDCEGIPLRVGARVTVHCNHHYEHVPALRTYDIICEANGEWNRELQPCVPKCGIPNSRGLSLISYGEPSPFGALPWHIGLYRDVDGSIIQFCGGSLVSSRTIVSAAHCFWEPDGTILKDIHVVAGKYYHDWDMKTKYVQHLEVKDIVIHKRYNGNTFQNDIALIILIYDVQLNEAVRPACVDYESDFLRFISPHTTIGNVTGWGFNEHQTQTNVLNLVNLPYVDPEECETHTDGQLSSLVTNDKFCAGHKNKTTVCKGDSGGGYTVRFRDGRLYLVGIVSVGPHETCALYPYAAFTNIYHHLDFIRQYDLIL